MKGMSYFSVVPTRNVLYSASQFATVFGLLIFAAVLISSGLAAFRAKKDYSRLKEILDLLSNPKKADMESQRPANAFLDPYNYITYNIINLFIQQDYLKVQTSEQKYKLRALELSALQQQINPHFLHNTLNAIYWEAVRLTGGSNVCSEIVTKLASIMRYSLSNPDELVTIEEELGYLKNYIYIQQQRYNDSFRMEYHINPAVLSCPIRKIILQPLVENAINHGIKGKPQGGTIRLKIHLCAGYIYISILDTGAGISRKKLAELIDSLKNTEDYNFHVGLLNAHRRLVLAYGSEAGLHIWSHEGTGTCIFFRIPQDGGDAGIK